MGHFYRRAVSHACSMVDLLPVKQVKVSFDPFASEILSARQFLYTVSSHKLKKTNPMISIKTEVKSDRSDPRVLVHFVDGHEAEFRTKNLNQLDILQTFNKLCKQRAVEVVKPMDIKSAKGKGKKGKR